MIKRKRLGLGSDLKIGPDDEVYVLKEGCMSEDSFSARCLIIMIEIRGEDNGKMTLSTLRPLQGVRASKQIQWFSLPFVGPFPVLPLRDTRAMAAPGRLTSHSVRVADEKGF